MLIGIDLGTTNSAIGLWRDGRAELIPNSLGSFLTPSAVSVDDDGGVLVGMAARDRQLTHPKQTATAFKRWMGTERATRLGNQSFQPEELSALVLRSLKNDAEKLIGEPVVEAVITVPAYFNDRQRRATRRAGELAGLRVERLVNEPTAAALAYGIHERTRETKFLVFDLGGGTFDVSVVELFEGVIEVRSSTGDNRLGGEDFNEAIVEDFFRSHAKKLGIPRPQDDQLLYQRVREQAERARRCLSRESSATLSVVWRDQEFTHQLDTVTLEKLCQPLLDRLREPVARALRDGAIDASTLNDVILIGGATRMPMVRRAVARMFGRLPGVGPNPDEAVAIGAAIQAGLKARDVALRDVVMTDVCPYSLGVNTAERRPDGGFRQNVFSPILERNTIVPASRVKRFATVQDGQRIVRFGVYQGESRDIEDNISLGAIEVSVPPRPAGEIAVDVRFTYDINGLLEVDVVVPESGETRQLLLLDDETRRLSQDLEERRAALAALKVHPRELDENRALMARAHRCYEQFLGARREAIGRIIAQFEIMLERQDPREIREVRSKVVAALDEIEGETYL
jgi:molecular chaperone HscC